MINLRLAFKKRAALHSFLVLTLAITILVWIGVACRLDASEWAAWVQAAGATAGICIAIWLPIKQKKDAAEAEEANKANEIHRLKLAIREELTGFHTDFYFPHSQYLISRSSEMIFNSLVPIYAYNFPVYAALVGRLTSIPEDHLRTSINDFYRLAESLLVLARENNRLIEELGRIDETLRHDDNWELKQQRNFTYSALQELCGRIRSLILEVPTRARNVADRLEA